MLRTHTHLCYLKLSAAAIQIAKIVRWRDRTSHMACLNTLKQEIRTLESIFTKNHERFQIVAASVDELSCRFIGNNGKKYEIHANITVSGQCLSFACVCAFLTFNIYPPVNYLYCENENNRVTTFFLLKQALSFFLFWRSQLYETNSWSISCLFCWFREKKKTIKRTVFGVIFRVIHRNHNKSFR